MTTSSPDASKFRIVALSGSLPGHCGMQELVAFDPSSEVYLLANRAGEKTATRFTKDEYRASLEAGEVTPLKEELDDIRGDKRGIYIRDKYRFVLGVRSLRECWSGLQHTLTEDGIDVFVAEVQTLKETLNELSLMVRESVDDYLMGMSISGSDIDREDWEKPLRWTDLGISAAQFDDPLRYSQLVRQAFILQQMGETTRLHNLYKISVGRRYGISLEDLLEEVMILQASLTSRSDFKAMDVPVSQEDTRRHRSAHSETGEKFLQAM